MKTNNLHPLFEQICSQIRPPSEIERTAKLVEAAHIKAERKMSKLKKIDIEIKVRKLCPNCRKEWNGIECNHCSFDIGFDPNWD